jgi:crossover junction endodeoxyribonuclease RuvC
MRVLGVDPGTRRLGWGVVEQHGTRLVHVAHGVVLAEGDDLADRLLVIERALDVVLREHAPASAAVETIFFAKNAQSAAKLGHARGVVLLCLRRGGLEVGEYSPALVKRALVGRGRAEKEQVARLVCAVLGLAETPASDAADALALAITHLRAASFLRAIGRGS